VGHLTVSWAPNFTTFTCGPSEIQHGRLGGHMDPVENHCSRGFILLRIFCAVPIPFYLDSLLREILSKMRNEVTVMKKLRSS
jgi:hypothetical protein